MTQNAIAPLNPSTTSGSALATKLVNAEQALLSQHAGSSRPSYAIEGTIWVDSDATERVVYLFDGTNDIPLYRYSTSTSRVRDRADETTIASASTTNAMGAATDRVAISGTATITSLGTEPSQKKYIRATGAFTLTHNATTLILPTGANIVAASGDTFVAMSDASGNVRVLAYQRASGSALTTPAGDIPSGSKMIFFQNAAPSGWTIDGTHNDKLMRVVSSAGGGSGGSLNFSTVFGYTATAGYTLLTADIPAHTHGPGSLEGGTDDSGTHNHDYQNQSNNNSRDNSGGTPIADDANISHTTSSDGNHDHFVFLDAGVTGSTGGGGSHAHNMDMRARYIDVIVCTKN